MQVAWNPTAFIVYYKQKKIWWNKKSEEKKHNKQMKKWQYKTDPHIRYNSFTFHKTQLIQNMQYETTNVIWGRVWFNAIVFFMPVVYLPFISSTYIRQSQKNVKSSENILMQYISDPLFTQNLVFSHLSSLSSPSPRPLIWNIPKSNFWLNLKYINLGCNNSFTDLGTWLWKFLEVSDLC